ncbi:MAG: DUF669 domain-containing protein [Candidatus Bipolaricaulota bacterium]
MKFTPEDLEDPNAPPPPGRYRVQIVSSREQESRAGNSVVHLQLSILDGPHAGKLISDYFVVEGCSAAAVRVGRQRLVALLRTFGITLRPYEEIDLASLEERVLLAELHLTVSVHLRHACCH